MSPPVERLLLAITVLFAAAGLFIAVAERVSRRRAGRIWVSYWVEFAVVAYLLVPLALGGGWYAAAIALMAVLTVREMLSVLRAGGWSPSAPVVWAGAAACLILAWNEMWGPLLAVIPCLLLIGVIWMAATRRGRSAVNARATMLAVAFPGWCLACCLALGQHENGFGRVFFLYAVVEVDDCCALLVGKFFGKRLIWPRLSPAKTAAGSAAGLVSAIGAGATFSFLLPGTSLAFCVAAGAALGLLGQAGDLAASAVKRWAGVKDYGALVPTNGGVLDVYDSFILAAPLWLLACLALGK